MGNFEVGYVILFRNRLTWKPLTWLGFLIRFICRTRYNHAAQVRRVYDPKAGTIQWNIVEAVRKGVIEHDLKTKLRGRTDYDVYRLKQEEIERLYGSKENMHAKINERLQAEIGQPYDFWSLFFFQLIYHLFGWYWGVTDKHKAAKNVYCYELIGIAFEEIFTTWWKIRPKDFLNSDKFCKIDVPI